MNLKWRSHRLDGMKPGTQAVNPPDTKSPTISVAQGMSFHRSLGRVSWFGPLKAALPMFSH